MPEIWREKMKQYFGIAPETDSEGVLQVIHWAMGLFGYFPSYALGTMISAQLQEQLKEILPDYYDRLILEGILTPFRIGSAIRSTAMARNTRRWRWSKKQPAPGLNQSRLSVI